MGSPQRKPPTGLGLGYDEVLNPFADLGDASTNISQSTLPPSLSPTNVLDFASGTAELRMDRGFESAELQSSAAERESMWSSEQNDMAAGSIWSGQDHTEAKPEKRSFPAAHSELFGESDGEEKPEVALKKEKGSTSLFTDPPKPSIPPSHKAFSQPTTSAKVANGTKSPVVSKSKEKSQPRKSLFGDDISSSDPDSDEENPIMAMLQKSRKNTFGNDSGGIPAPKTGSGSIGKGKMQVQKERSLFDDSDGDGDGLGGITAKAESLDVKKGSSLFESPEKKTVESKITSKAPFLSSSQRANNHSVSPSPQHRSISSSRGIATSPRGSSQAPLRSTGAYPGYSTPELGMPSSRPRQGLAESPHAYSHLLMRSSGHSPTPSQQQSFSEPDPLVNPNMTSADRYPTRPAIRASASRISSESAAYSRYPPNAHQSPQSQNRSYTEVAEQSASPNQALTGSETLDITVSDPIKVGDPLKSYILYKVRTLTHRPPPPPEVNANAIRGFTAHTNEPTERVVSRRYRDFLHLYTHLATTHPGIVVPPIPHKQSLGRFSDHFVETRRIALERCLRRIAMHHVLRNDEGFRNFLTFEDWRNQRSRGGSASESSLLSGTGTTGTGAGPGFGMGILDSIFTAKTPLQVNIGDSDLDTDMAERLKQLATTETQLRALLKSVEHLIKSRHALAFTSQEFGSALVTFSQTESSKGLVQKINWLANMLKRIKGHHERMAGYDQEWLESTVEEYVRITESVRVAMAGRAKVVQRWEATRTMLKRKKEALLKRSNSCVDSPADIPQNPSTPHSHLQSEVLALEARCQQQYREAYACSTLLQSELHRIDQEKIVDMQKSICGFLVGMVSTQRLMCEAWRNYLSKTSGNDEWQEDETRNDLQEQAQALQEQQEFAGFQHQDDDDHGTCPGWSENLPNVPSTSSVLHSEPREWSATAQSPTIQIPPPIPAGASPYLGAPDWNSKSKGPASPISPQSEEEDRPISPVISDEPSSGGLREERAFEHPSMSDALHNPFAQSTEGINIQASMPVSPLILPDDPHAKLPPTGSAMEEGFRSSAMAGYRDVMYDVPQFMDDDNRDENEKVAPKRGRDGLPTKEMLFGGG